MKSEKHLKSENRMKTTRKLYAFHEKRALFMRFSKDHLQGIVTLCFIKLDSWKLDYEKRVNTVYMKSAGVSFFGTHCGCYWHLVP